MRLLSLPLVTVVVVLHAPDRVLPCVHDVLLVPVSGAPSGQRHSSDGGSARYLRLRSVRRRRSIGNPAGGSLAKASVGGEQTLVKQNADASVGHGEYTRLDKTGVDADDIGCHEKQGPPECGHDQRDGPPSPEDRTEQKHRRNHLDTLLLPIYARSSQPAGVQWRTELYLSAAVPVGRSARYLRHDRAFDRARPDGWSAAVPIETSRFPLCPCAEPSRLAFTWHFPDEPESVVALDLEPSATASELRLTHSALGDLVTSYRDGWCVHLSYLEAAALATPLPASMFWQLYGTIAQLNAR